MTSRGAWLINDSMSAEDIRMALAAVQLHETALRARPGVVPSPSNPLLCAISSGMNVTVQPGQAVIAGVRGGAQGVYHWTEDSVRTLTLDAGDPAQPRIDVIVLRIRDAWYSDTATDFTLTVVKGTPNASPVAPTYSGTAALGSAYALATVRVPAGASAGTGGLVAAGATIQDFRGFAVAAGGILPVVSAAQAAGVPMVDGTYVDRTDLDRLQRNNGAALDAVIKVRQEIAGVANTGGVVAPANATTQIATAAITLTVPAIVEIEATVSVTCASSTDTIAGYFRIREGTTVLHGAGVGWRFHNQGKGAGLISFRATAEINAAAGAHTYNVAIVTDAGSAGFNVYELNYSIREIG